MDNQNSSSKGIVKIIAGLVVVAIVGLVWWKSKDASTDTTVPAANNTGTTQNTTPSDTPAVVSRKYKDGSYTASGNYVSPAGQEEVQVTLVIKDDKISSATFVGKAVNPTSKMMQGNFSSGFSTLVTGKSLDEVALTVVNGSSLTPKGFMEAVAKIKLEAKA